MITRCDSSRGKIPLEPAGQLIGLTLIQKLRSGGSDMMTSVDPLVEAARKVRLNAYAPYSGYLVGAAIEDERGDIHVGANVENVSFGATICAERSAVTGMIAAGGKRATRLALVTKDGGTPCGMCLQVLAEFCGEPAQLKIVVADENDVRKEFTLADLLPHGFDSSQVKRT